MLNDVTEIPLSKGKLVKGLIASVAFVCIGAWLLLFRPESGNPVFNNPLVKYGAAILSIVFFGWAGFYFARKLRDRRPGLIIDRHGIVDNSSAVPLGLLPWQDIQAFKSIKVGRQQFIVIVVNNPEVYMARETSFIQKQGMKYNRKMYGSPLVMTANGLQTNTEELLDILNKKLSAYKPSSLM
jgi:hypothetical protein